MNIQIRDLTTADEPFVYSTMLRSLYYGNSYYNSILQSKFFQMYPIVIRNLIAKSAVRIACLPDEPDVILGYALLEPNIIHFVYVKEAWRKQGVAKALTTDHTAQFVTHITKIGNAIRLNKKLELDPFLI